MFSSLYLGRAQVAFRTVFVQGPDVPLTYGAKPNRKKVQNKNLHELY